MASEEPLIREPGLIFGVPMPHALRNRFWAETILGSVTGVLDIVTLFWHNWIETVCGVDPDKGSM
jgi:hypothetical protein